MSCDRPEPTTATKCDPCSPSERNRYFPGRRLTVADYQLEQRNLIARRRLINRAMLGQGVVEGLAVDPVTQDRDKNRGVIVGPGFAIDAKGRELVACDAVKILHPDDVLWLEQHDGCVRAGKPPAEPAPEGETKARLHFLLSAHYAEKPVDAVSIDNGCEPARCEATHICETVVYSLLPIDTCPSGIPDCPENLWPPQPCPTNDRTWKPVQEPGIDPTIAKVGDRGTHEQLVQWSLDRLDHGLCRVDALDRVGPLFVALDDGVPLACVEVAFDCDKAVVVWVPGNGTPRRLAYPNFALFDLVRGCDLTRIQNVGWAEWLPHDRRLVSFRDFAAKFVAPDQPGKSNRTRAVRRQPVETSFWICFSGPVQVSSLTPDIIAITLIQRDENEDVGELRRIPIRAIDVADTTTGDPPGTTRACRPRVSFRFWNGEINPANSSGFEEMTLVEIEVRTAFIIDSIGQKVAGGGRYVPSDDCVPGGRFLSSFVVLQAEEEPDTGEAEAAEQDGDTPETSPPAVKGRDDTSQPAAVPPAQGGLK